MFGQRLRLARKRAGLSMRDLASRVSPRISAQAVSKYESGKMMPSSAVLVGLGRTLDVSLDFLMGGYVEELIGVEFRKHSGTSAKDRAKAESIVIEVLEKYFVIEEILQLDPLNDSFANINIKHVDSYEEVDELALELRQRWLLGIDPIPSMTGLLEEKGIAVVQADLPLRFDGLSCEAKRGDDRRNVKVVVVSCRTGVERKRFNLAHELAHHVVRSTDAHQLKPKKAMNRFAGAFLVPSDHLAAEVGRSRNNVTYHELIRLKWIYGVSASAMLMRLGQVGILSKSTVDYTFRSYARSWRTKEPEPIRDGKGFGTLEKPQRFELLVWRALGEQLISPVRAAELLQQPLSTVEQEIRGPTGR